MKKDLLNKMINSCDCNNLQQLLIMKQEVLKLKDDLRRIKEEKKTKEQRIEDIRDGCSDKILVKICEHYKDEKEINYYCLLCEKKISNMSEILNQEGIYLVDFSEFKYDGGRLSVSCILEIVFEMFKEIKESHPETLNEEIIRYVNESIKIEDDYVKEKVARKLFESINVFQKRKVY